MVLKMNQLLIVWCLFLSFSNYSQSKYQFLQEKRKKQTISFELINNLIVVPVEINQKKFSFILDTGVSKTILFNIEKNDSLQFKNVRKSRIQGLGKGNAIQALITSGNKVSLKNIVNFNEEMYVILKSYFDFSAKMGTEIHGILGYNLLKDFIVKIDYKSKKIVFYDPIKYTIKKCRKCEVLPISIYNKKPYLDIKIQLDTIGNSNQIAKMLIDSGGSESLWLFENSKENIKTPKRYFNDILGEGLSGIVYGNRSRIPKIKIGTFNIEKPTASFLDSLTTKNARKFKQRNGSIGAEILKRFKIWLNYSENKIILKKTHLLKTYFIII